MGPKEAIMSRTIKGLCFTLALIFLMVRGKVFATMPMEQIRETLQQVMTGPSNGDEKERSDTLRNALMPRFDWNEMAKRVLGRHWDSVGNRQDEFVAAFAEFLGNSYMGKIGSYKDEKVLFVDERTENNRAQVDTKIVPSKGEPTSVSYRLHRVQGDWKIYDVVVEDISIVSNYRSQFERILARGNFDDLMKRLKDKDSKSRN
jgi:phospholipid transport system substrate-binding protein